MQKIVLASASPRRKELMEKTGLKFEVDPVETDENVESGKNPHEIVREISLQKAMSVSGKHRDAVIIAADTIGFLNGQIIGKPHNPDEARKILQLLSGKSHIVITGFTIIDSSNNKTVSQSVETKVYIKKLSQQEIDAYISTGEPLDKAGAYGIQGLGSVIVEKIEGDYYNVVGLPLHALSEALKAFGINIV